MKQKYKKILSLIGLSFFVANLVFVAATPVMIYAQAVPTPAATSTPQGPVPSGAGEQSIAAYLCVPGTGLYPCINRLYRFALAAAFFITVLFIVFAGYQYMLGGEKGKEDAKGRISAAVIAIVILSTSFILLRQINPDLVKFKKIDPLPVDTSGDKGKLLDLLPLCKDVGNKPPCRGLDIPGSDDPDGGAAGSGTNGGTSLDLNETACGLGGTDYSVNCVNLRDKTVGIDCKGPSPDNCWVQKTLASKLLVLASNTTKAGVYFQVTEAWKPTKTDHKDQCHNTGACVDMGVTTGTFKQLCAAFPGTGLSIWNETGETSTECGADHKNANSTGSHLHVYLGSSGGGGTTSDAGGSGGPYCIPVHGFLCDHPAGISGTYPQYPATQAKTSSNPEIQGYINRVLAAVTQLQNIKDESGSKPFANVTIAQLYRPHEYGAHMRSVFEAGALIRGWSETQVKARGFYCDGSIQYVKKSQVENLSETVKNYINTHWSQHAMSLETSYDTTCLSDHGFGFAVDLENANSRKVEQAAESVGLCHNLPGDTKHYVLKDKNRNNKGCSWSSVR
ncbi:MAG: hypothetical protein IT410_03570 [Candidatus Doudnabacteria bacterium]|nr:hypothetical protein [Candidatus Doudnabacteria bacterium]